MVDTKYKVRQYDPGDKKVGINQTDLYQMVSYGLRRNTQEVLLLYPRAFQSATSDLNSAGPPLGNDHTFTVNSGLMLDEPIYIRTVDLTVTGTSKQEMVSTLVGQLEQVLGVPVGTEVDSSPKEG